MPSAGGYAFSGDVTTCENACSSAPRRLPIGCSGCGGVSVLRNRGLGPAAGCPPELALAHLETLAGEVAHALAG